MSRHIYILTLAKGVYVFASFTTLIGSMLLGALSGILDNMPAMSEEDKIKKLNAPEGMKWCTYCQSYKLFSEFAKAGNTSNGYQTGCTVCKRTLRANTVAKKKEQGVDYGGTKICRACNKEKSRTDFSEDYRNKDCLNSMCKECDFNRNKNWKEQQSRIYSPDRSGTKQCTKCGETKPKTEFHQDSIRADGLFPWCNGCSNGWFKEHPEVYGANAARRRIRVNTNLTKKEKKLSISRRKRIKNNPCHYCGEFKEKMEIEHFIPLAIGGTDIYYNLVSTCKLCNLEKGTLTGYEYIERRKSEGRYTPHK